MSYKKKNNNLQGFAQADFAGITSVFPQNISFALKIYLCGGINTSLEISTPLPHVLPCTIKVSLP